jgi:hypothetical protein
MAAKKRAKGVRSRKAAEPTRGRARTRDPRPAPDVKRFLDKWKDEKKHDRERGKRERQKKREAAEAVPSPPPPATPSKATDSGRNVAGLTKIWRMLERAEELVITGGVGVSVTRTLMDEYSLPRRAARMHQAAAYLRLAEESEREGRPLRLVRYRRMLETIHERAMLLGEFKSAVAAVLGLVKMDGGFDRPGLQLPGGREKATGHQSALEAVIDAPEEQEPVRMTVEQLTSELVAARERGEEV